MDPMIIQLLTGPVAALGLCIVALYYIGKWIGTHVPKIIEKHMEQIDKIVSSHEEDRTMYKESLETLTTTMTGMKEEIKDIKKDVKEIKKSLPPSQVL